MVFDETKERLLLPPVEYLVEDMELPIYKESIISNIDNVDLVNTHLINAKSNGTPKFRRFDEDFILNSNELNNNFKLLYYHKRNLVLLSTSLIFKSKVLVLSQSKERPLNGYR